MARRSGNKPAENATENEGLSVRMRELISKATVEERRKSPDNESSSLADKRRRRDDKRPSDEYGH